MNSWETAVDGVKRCLSVGVTEFVICAGARNAALVEVLTRAEKSGQVRIWRHFEERSAGFFALGRTMQTGLPCAVVTTSGTAVAELLPAMVEAFYQNRPLVALTADRPAEFRGSGAPQCIDQNSIFGNYAYQGELSAWDGKGPAHVNLEFQESFEPAEIEFTEKMVCPFTPAKDRLDVAELARWLREDHFKGFAVMIGGLESDEREEVFHFCRDFGAPVVVEAASGLREALNGLSIHDADRVLKKRPPGKILRLGEVPSGRFWRDLETLPAVSVWSVCRNGLPGLARASKVTRGPLDRVIQALGTVETADDALDLLVGAPARAAQIEELLERFPDSEPALIRTISQFACIGSGVFLGNSLPIREWNLFAQWRRPVMQVRANRGANGIDGQVSTWLGTSADLRDAWAVIGDLTALYDLAAPYLLGQTQNLGRTLAVIQNHGGRIFERLPSLSAMNTRAVECMVNTHHADLAGLATLWGMRHVRVHTADDMDACTECEKTTMLEVIPDSEQTAHFWAKWDRMDLPNSAFR